MKFYNIIEEFKNELKLKNLSPHTVKIYSGHCLRYFQFFNKHPLEITEKELKTYILNLTECNVSAKSRNQKVYSIKSYYKLMDTRSPINITSNLPRQKEPLNLPAIFSKEEIVRILTSLGNIKHRAILAITYSSGLRLKEVRHLKISDINSERKTILINGKGSKQRYTPLCDEVLLVLRKYYKLFKPKFWLFEGGDGKSPMAERSVQNIFKNAIQKSGINKPATFHTLRHCYATHLLEAGTNLHTIQKVLGHKNIRSTLIYTHVTEEVIIKIKSPLINISLPVSHTDRMRGDVI